MCVYKYIHAHTYIFSPTYTHIHVTRGFFFFPRVERIQCTTLLSSPSTPCIQKQLINKVGQKD